MEGERGGREGRERGRERGREGGREGGEKSAGCVKISRCADNQECIRTGD